MRDIISRFAPAPTGYLHLGHIVNAVYVWRETRARNGCILLRIEDHDRQRSRPQFEAAILEDLAWLGFAADEPPVRQSERGDIYEEALASLRARGLVYACNCSRADIVLANGAPASTLDGARASTLDGARGSTLDGARASTLDGARASTLDGARASTLDGARASTLDGARASTFDGARAFQASGSDAELRYPGTCAHRGLAEGPGLGLRVRLDPSVERFVDLRRGTQEQQPSEQCGDLLVRDRDGNWTYQFAATVDDWVQGVTLVIRGEDLLASTGRQIQLARLLGRAEPPQFLHHALIMKSPDQKLSKSDGATGVRELRAKGWTPAQVIERAISLVGA
jgi:glutamyl/glutaminyl-tRNA synthetase